MNNVLLIGRISTDPDTRYTSGSQTAVAERRLKDPKRM